METNLRLTDEAVRIIKDIRDPQGYNVRKRQSDIAVVISDLITFILPPLSTSERRMLMSTIETLADFEQLVRELSREDSINS